MLTDTDTGTDRNKKQDLWKAKQRYIEGLEVRKNAPKKKKKKKKKRKNAHKKNKRCIEGLEVKKKKKKCFEKSHSKKLLFLWDFPGGPGIKNPPTNAGFDSSYGKIPHAVE